MQGASSGEHRQRLKFRTTTIFRSAVEQVKCVKFWCSTFQSPVALLYQENLMCLAHKACSKWLYTAAQRLSLYGISIVPQPKIPYMWRLDANVAVCTAQPLHLANAACFHYEWQTMAQVCQLIQLCKLKGQQNMKKKYACYFVLLSWRLLCLGGAFLY